MAAFSLRFCARLFYSSGIRWENSGSASMSKSSSSSSVEDYFVPPESVRGCTVLDRSAFLVNSDRCLLRAGGKSPLHFGGGWDMVVPCRFEKRSQFWHIDHCPYMGSGGSIDRHIILHFARC